MVFIVVVTVLSFLADLAGEKSTTGPGKIIAWLCGSLIAFKIFEMINEEKD